MSQAAKSVRTSAAPKHRTGAREKHFIPNYPTKLFIYRHNASKYWWVRYFVNGNPRLHLICNPTHNHTPYTFSEINKHQKVSSLGCFMRTTKPYYFRKMRLQPVLMLDILLS
jgi:hypothetical protein